MHATLYRLDRTSERLPIGRASTLRGPDGDPIDVRIEDLSTTGCRLSTPISVEADEEIMIGLPGVGMRAARVIWQQEGEAGCAFTAPLAYAEVQATRTSETLMHVDFQPLPVPSIALDAPLDREIISPRMRLAVILVAAITAWALIAALASGGYFLAASWLA
jgi:hypothetical protein